MKKIGLEIKELTRSFAVFAAILLPLLHAAPAHALNFHSWVSHNGSDTNDCARASPCASFSAALSQTADDGEITCLDSGNFYVSTITISVVIDCRGTVTTNLLSDLNLVCLDGITINAPGRVVTLRGLTLNGFGLNGTSTCGFINDVLSINGITIQAATAVYIEDCVIENFTTGIIDVRTSGLTRLVIKNTIVRNNLASGIAVEATPKNSVVLDNVHSVDNGNGITVFSSDNVIVSRSVLSENQNGIGVAFGGQVIVDNTEISHNLLAGIFVETGIVTLANSDIAFNNASISGATTSYGNNRFVGNGGGDAPTLIGQQ